MRTRTVNASRLVAKAIKTSGFKMRSLSGGSPDVINVSVVADLGDGWYSVQRDHWPITISVPVSPPQAKIPIPTRALMMFEDGDSQRPFLFWPFGKPDDVRPGSLGTALDWTNLFSDGSRSNRIMGYTFDPGAASSSAGPSASTALWVRQQDGDLAWSDGAGKLFFNGTEIYDGYTSTDAGWPTATFQQFDSVTLKDGVIYVTHSFSCLAAFLTDGTMLWNTVIFSDQGVPGGQFDGYWLTNADPVIVGNRVVCMGELYDSGIVDRDSKVLITVNASDGGDFWYWFWQQYEGYVDTVYSLRQFNAGPAFWVSGQYIYFEGYSGEIVCIKINQETPFTETIWESDFVYGTAERRRRILGLCNGAVICAYEQHEWEQVTDNLRELQWNNLPDVQQRWTYKDPAEIAVGVHSGVEALSMADGSQVGTPEVEPGSTTWKTWYGPITDYHVDGPEITWGGYGKFEIWDDGNVGVYDWRLWPDTASVNGANAFFIKTLSGLPSLFLESYEWEDPDFDPEAKDYSAFGGASEYTGSVLFGWEKWKTWFNDQVADAVSYISEELQRFKAMGDTRSDPSDFLRQAFVRVNTVQRLYKIVGGGFDKSDYVDQSLTVQYPTFTSLGEPVYGGNGWNGYFVETFDGGLGDLLDNYQSEGATYPSTGSGPAGPWVWSPNISQSFNSLGPKALRGGDDSAQTISHRYLWRNRPERDVLRTPDIPIQAGCSCQIGSLLVVAGQSTHSAPDYYVQWRAYNASGEEVWRHTAAGNTQIESAPFADDENVYTVINNAGSRVLYCLDADGTFVSSTSCPDLENPTFDGVDTWIAEDGRNQFG